MAETNKPRQLPLQIRLRDDATFDNFLVGEENQALIRYLRQWTAAIPDEGNEACLLLWGASGLGRSHLLQAVCHNVALRDLQVLYLPLGDLLEYPPRELLENLDNISICCA